MLKWYVNMLKRNQERQNVANSLKKKYHKLLNKNNNIVKKKQPKKIDMDKIKTKNRMKIRNSLI